MNAISQIDNGDNCQLTVNGGTFTTDGFENSGAIYNGIGNTMTIENITVETSGDCGASVENQRYSDHQWWGIQR